MRKKTLSSIKYIYHIGFKTGCARRDVRSRGTTEDKQRRGKGAGSSSRSAELTLSVGKSTLPLALFRPLANETALWSVLRTWHSLPLALSSTDFHDSHLQLDLLCVLFRLFFLIYTSIVYFHSIRFCVIVFMYSDNLPRLYSSSNKQALFYTRNVSLFALHKGEMLSTLKARFRLQ